MAVHADRSPGGAGSVPAARRTSAVARRSEQSPAAGEPPYGTAIQILSVAYGDLDQDGSDETIAELGCMVEGGSKQLVAYDRDRSGGIVSLGQVTATTGPVRDIRTGSTWVSASGIITAVAGDYQRCCDDQTPQTWQTRGYALRHGRFDQVSGPVRMPVNPHVTKS